MGSASTTAGILLGSALGMLAQSPSGSFSTTEVTNAATNIMTVFVILGGIFLVIGFIFAALKMAGRDKMDAIYGVLGIIFGGIVIGYSKTWASSITGIAIP